MKNLTFKKWFEDNAMDASKNLQATQAVKSVGQTGIDAALNAQRKGKNPLTAAQQAVLQQAAAGKVPMNKLGDVLPKDPDQGNE